MTRQRAHEPPTGRSDSTGASSGVAPAALAAGGWLLLLVALPIAIFLTWWGDCFEETCPAASDVERAVYLFDFGAWLALPAIAFGAYRGWRPAAVALLVVGLAIVAQVVAAMFGARGFQAFAIVLPAGALLVTAGLLGIRPSLGVADDRSTSRRGLVGLIVLAAVVVAVAFQGLLVGGLGPGQGLLVIVAIGLSFVALLAFLNTRRRAPARDRPRAAPTDPRRRRR